MAFGEIAGYVAAFLVGVATQYVCSRLLDWRRSATADKRAQDNLDRVESEIPDLIQEMRADVKEPEYRYVRDFYVLESENTEIGGTTGSRKIFRYNRAEHQDLDSKINLLKGQGYVVDEAPAPGQAKHYRMTEEFVELLRST